MIRCRIPVIAAVNSPTVGLGCSLAALSDIVYMAPTAHFADPHVSVGLGRRRRWPVGGPCRSASCRPREFALTGQKISAQRSLELGLANHVVEDPVAEAIGSAGHPETTTSGPWATRRLMNIQLERSVQHSLDYANLSEFVSFGTAGL